MKLIKKDFPFIVMIEDKISKSTLKPYVDTAIGIKEKNPNPTSLDDKYIVKWFHLREKEDLLKFASICENAYNNRIEDEIKEHKEKKEKEAKKEPQTVGEYLDGGF